MPIVPANSVVVTVHYPRCYCLGSIMAIYFPTKYDNAAHEVIALLSDMAEGYGRDSTGDVDSPVGHTALVFLDDTCDLNFYDTTGAYPTGDLAGEIARGYGVRGADVRGSHIVTHDSQGYVYVESFGTPAEARTVFDCRAARYGAWSDHGDTCGTAEAWSSCPTTPDDECDWDGLYICTVTGHGYHIV